MYFSFLNAVFASEIAENFNLVITFICLLNYIKLLIYCFNGMSIPIFTVVEIYNRTINCQLCTYQFFRGTI